MAATSTELLTTRLRNQQLIDSTPAQSRSRWCRGCARCRRRTFPPRSGRSASRAPGCQDGDVEQAFNDGLILRTHVLRPTWHFVTPQDIRWLLALSAPRIHAANDYYYRQSGLDAKTFAKSCAMIHRALEGGKTMTRAELAVYSEAREDSGRWPEARLLDDARRARRRDHAAGRAAASSSPTRCSTSARPKARR